MRSNLSLDRKRISLYYEASMKLLNFALKGAAMQNPLSLQKCFLFTVLLCLLQGWVSNASPLSDYWDTGEVRKAIESLPDLSKMERVLRFEVRDADSGEILPEVAYWIYERSSEEGTPFTATGQYEHTLPPGFSQTFYYKLKAPGYGTQMWRLILDNVYHIEVPVKVALVRAKPVMGKVLNEEGDSIPSVKVLVSGNTALRNYPGRMNYYEEATSDAEGKWRLDDFPQDIDKVNLSLAHPDYLSDLYSNSREFRLEEETEIVQVMKRGFPFKGRVLDAEGAPVPNALIKINVGDIVQTESDESGNFSFENFGKEFFQRHILKVSAAGYVTKYLLLSAIPANKDCKITLSQGQVLRVRLFTPEGKPVANEKIWVSVGYAYRAQVDHFDLVTDAEGNLAVEDAPENAIWSFSAYHLPKAHYQTIKETNLEPGETVHRLQFQPATSIALLAVDEKTGKPIESFMVFKGSIRKIQQRGGGVTWWSPESWWDYFSEAVDPEEEVEWGIFTISPASRVFSAQYSHYEDNPIMFRVEAEGYYPAETPRIEKDDGEVLLKVRMKKGEPLRVRAVDGQGNPANDASASWVSVKKDTYLFDGSIRNAIVSTTAYADQEGWLKLPVIEQRNHVLVILSEKGSAFLSAGILRNNQVITLSPWGRVEGVVSPAILKMASRSIRMGSKVTLAGLKISVNEFAEADSTGHFKAKYLLPGVYEIGTSSEPYGTTIMWSKFTAVQGETAKVILGGGRAVQGRLNLEDDALDAFKKYSIQLSAVQITNKQDSYYSMNIEVDEDGAFQIEVLPPGEYKLTGYIINNAIEIRGQALRFVVKDFPFSVDGSLEDAPLDLGKIEVQDLFEGRPVPE